MKSVLEIILNRHMVWKLLLDFTACKSYLGSNYKHARNMSKGTNKDAGTTSIDLAPVSLL